MNDGLSNSKRKFIENWRQTVSMFMESGNICRTTIAEVTPEPQGPVFLRRIPGESHNTTDALRIEDVGSPVLPAVRFSYCHAEDDVTKQERKDNRRHHDNHREKRSNGKSTTLPPSPNGVIVQNGGDMPAYSKRKNVLKSVENRLGSSEIQELKPVKMETNTRKSTKTAREIYEKYNMKSQTHNMLMNNQSEHGVYSMPWRNKTFLSLPLRFNGNIPRKQKSASRQSAIYSDFKLDDFSDTDDVKFNREWTDIGF